MDTLQPTIKLTEVSSIIKTAELAARTKLQAGVTLNTMLGAAECNVKTDGTLLAQVLMNLLVNACKFTSKGAITFGYEVYDDELYFFVKDTGIGLAPEIKDRLIALFENGDTNSPGLGFGMPVVYSIMQKLNGNIGVESRGAGRGSTFWFTIPYSAEDAKETPAESPVQAAANVSTQALSANPTILVAEDNLANMMLFERILQKKYNVLCATDGVEAVELYKQHHPDLIIMDIQMPNMDGYGAVREIRKISQDVPIIAATAYAFVTDRQRLLENGFNGYISKPINITRLEQEITNCLSK